MVILLTDVCAYAAPRDAELVVLDIAIDPPNPKNGDLVKLVGEIYNAGIKQTDSFASIITVAYFVDGQLLYLNEIPNIESGINNKIIISSPPIWKVESGNHVIKIILDYHNTLQNQHDSPDDNIIEKTISIQLLKHTHLSLDVSPNYIVQDKDVSLNISGTLSDLDTNESLSNKKIILNLMNNSFTTKTNHVGKISFMTMIDPLKIFDIHAYFEGDTQYASSNVTLSTHILPKEISSSMLLRIHDEKNKYNFINFPFTVVIFQNSYDTLFKKIQSSSELLLDQETLLIPLPAGSKYFAEIYIDGRFITVTDKEQLTKDTVIVKELKIPETSMIRFHVINNQNSPINGAFVQNWIYSAYTEDGFTDWIDVLPTTSKEPYVAKIVLPDKRIIYSEPFLVFSGERKTIDIIIQESEILYKIPSWIKTNAGWWASGQIDDNSFIQGIQFLIKNGIIQIK
jgi:hypothetical protein